MFYRSGFGLLHLEHHGDIWAWQYRLTGTTLTPTEQSAATIVRRAGDNPYNFEFHCYESFHSVQRFKKLDAP